MGLPAIYIFSKRKTKRKTLTGGTTFNILPIITIDKHFLTKRVGNLPRSLCEQVEAGLELILTL